MPRPRTGHVRFVVYLKPEIRSAIQEEARQRRVTMGHLIEEAFQARIVKITRR